MKIVSLKVVLFYGLLALLVVNQVEAQPVTENNAPEDGATRQTHEERLLSTVRKNGSIRVIVRLKVPFTPEGGRSVEEVETQRANIVQAVERLLDRMPRHRTKPTTKRYKTIPLVAMEINAGELGLLLSDPDIANIEEDVAVPPSLTQSVPLVGATAAWSPLGYTGTGQKIAILDTGVDKYHPFLTGKIVNEACFSTTNASDGATSLCPSGSTDLGINCAATIYGCDHGTHVAGITAGNGTSLGVQSGVAKDAQLISVQVFSQFTDSGLTKCSDIPLPSPCALSYTSDQVLALEWVDGLRDTSIAAVNMSLGGGANLAHCDSSSRKEAIDSLRSVGIATVIASGNDGYINAIAAPACISTAVSVGSTTDGITSAGVISTDAVSSFSNSYAYLSLLAPGEVITSAVPGGFFANKWGTSMAAPHAAGAWAVLKGRNPTATVEQVLSALRNSGKLVTDARNSITTPRIQLDTALTQDTDGDTVLDLLDNCPNVANPSQADADHDGVGDVCKDTDGDSIPDDLDLCPGVFNGQTTFTENPLVATTTTIKAMHVTQLRTAVNALRAAATLPVATWTDPTLTVKQTLVRVAHIQELRDRLNEALTILQCPLPVYTDPVLTAKSTLIKAPHIEELRKAVNGKK
jgi:subtilisin family serine protease